MSFSQICSYIKIINMQPESLQSPPLVKYVVGGLSLLYTMSENFLRLLSFTDGFSETDRLNKSLNFMVADISAPKLHN